MFMEMSRVNYYDVKNGRRVVENDGNTSSIFITSSSATVYEQERPPIRPPLQGLDSVDTFVSSKTFPIATI